MNILVIGSGGREHSLTWKIAQSEQVDELYVAPGNGGMVDIASCVDINVGDHDAVVDFCREKDISFVVIGPEAPLVDGLSDRLAKEGILTFGPSADAAILEGSKGFTKDLCAKYSIPTAAYGRFENAAEAKSFVNEKGAPIVIKADGLAAGKGVIIAETILDAETAIDEMFDGRFGNAGAEIVVEEFLEGEEASFFAISDGETIVPMVGSQDHKRAFDNDEGPNTGGMGAYSPAPVFTSEIEAQTMKQMLEPTVKALAERGAPYCGVLYAGLMINEDGPKLIEYNARFGDPECQVMMRRMKSDIVPILYAAAKGDLEGHKFEWHDDAAALIVLAAKGYPEAYEKGSSIKGVEQANDVTGVEIFHAGTKIDNDQLTANGGRVLNVTATGATGKEAIDRAYKAVKLIDWPDGFYRNDIGWRMLEREDV